jgi:hypothetical protein
VNRLLLFYLGVVHVERANLRGAQIADEPVKQLAVRLQVEAFDVQHAAVARLHEHR